MSNYHLHSEKEQLSHDIEHSANHPHHTHIDIKSIKRQNQTVLKTIMCVTLLFAVIEAIGGFWSGSLALLSDSCHMLTDSASLLLALFMAHLSEKPADDSHSYGHGRADTLGAFVNSIFMLLIIVFLVYEGVSRLIHPQDIKPQAIIFIASIGLVINLFSFFMLHDKSHSLNTRAALIHIIGDLLGTIATIIAGIIIYYTHYTILDPILSLIVSIIMVPSTWLLMKKSIHILMEGVPEHLQYNDIGNSLAQIHKIVSVHDLHVWTMNSENISLSAHICIHSKDDWNLILTQCQAMLAQKFNITHVTLQPEIVKHDIINFIKK